MYYNIINFAQVIRTYTSYKT